MTELLSYREQFPILAETNYLISHSLGPMPLEAKARLDEYAHTWSTRGIRAWREGWWETPITIGDKIARLIGAPPGSVVMHQNVTIAAAVVLSCFPFGGERRRIVYGDGEFPSVRYVMQGAGAEVVVVPGQEELLEAIDERTQLVLLSHVLFRTGLIQDVEPVIRRTHEAGAHVLLDAYQSVGAVPLDVGSLRVDFATGGSVKWLCGGPGAGWLYIRPDLAERLEPGFVGWQAHAEPFAFEPEIRHAAGAARFLTGTPNVPALYAASAGYDIVHEVGAYVVLDAYQSVGAVPLDVTALGVDFAVGGSVKWLCGGPGAGWLYVRPDLVERLEPTLVGWQAHKSPFDFAPELEYADGVARFLTGTPNVPALYAATAGYDIVEEIGVDRIRENSVRQTELLVSLLDEAGFEVMSPRDPDRRGASVVVRTPDFAAVHAELDARDILCDFRPDVGLRIGPHFFNTDAEIELIVSSIREVVGRGAGVSAPAEQPAT